MPAATSLLQKAIQLSKAGRKEDARCLLLGILRLEPVNEAAWSWYVDTFDDRAGRIAALERFLKAVPDHTAARTALNRLCSGAVRSNLGENNSTVFTSEPEVIHRTSCFSRIAPFLVALGILFFSVAGLWYAFQELSGFQQLYRAAVEQRDAVQRDLIRLQSDHAALQQELASVRYEFENLNTQYSQLYMDYGNLKSQHDQLNVDYGNLKSQYDQLNQGYSTLNEAYQQLSGTHNQLLLDYADLEARSIQPPYIFIHDRVVEMSFYRTDGTIWGWNISFEGLENSIRLGYETREDLPIEYVVTNQGVELPVPDFAIFVDSVPFIDVIDTLYHDSESPDAFINEVWHIVTQLSHWTEDEGEVPRYPLETLLAGGGDCEDLSILFASLIRAAPVDWDVNLVYIDSENLRDPQEPDHVIVHLNTGERDYFIETTNDQVMEPYTNGVVGWYKKIE